MKKFIILLILVAAVSGFYWGFSYGDSPVPVGDSVRYDTMALTILEKGPFNNDFIFNKHIDKPIYPLFLALAYGVFGHNYPAAKIIQILLFVFLAILVYWLCQMLFNERTARLAGLGTALCYSIASFAGRFYRELFFCFLVFLLIYCLYQAQLKKKNIWFIFSGIAAGLAILTNAVFQFFPLLIIINFLIVGRGQGIKKLYPKIIIFFLAFSLAAAPWLISDYLNFGRLPFGPGSGGGSELAQRAEKMRVIEGKYLEHFIGNSLGDFFAYKFFPDYNPRDSRYGWEARSAWVSGLEQGEEIEDLNKELIQQAKKEIISHPLMFLKTGLIDFLKLNTPMLPNVEMQHLFVGTHPELSDFAKEAIILIIRLIYLLFFALIIYAFIKYIKQWRKIGWLVLVILYFNLIYSNLFAIARYSVPLYPFYIIFASLGLVALWDKIVKKMKYESK